MIQVEELTKYFGPVLAVDHISFEVDKGEIVGFLGPNGAGKTTTIRMLTTWLPATSGIAKVAGYDVMMESMEVRRNIGYLPESVPLYGEMRVEEYLDYRARLKGLPRKDRLRRVESAMERCRVKQVRGRLVGTLSKGYRQRVGLADALVHDPPILILDEPTAGLDPIQIHETLALIRELGEDHTILLSTHILSEVELVCERVIIINAGTISFSETLDELERETVIILELRGPINEIRTAVGKLDGVRRVEDKALSDGVAQLTIHTAEDRDLREELFRLAAERNWPIRRLERERRRLEDAFFEAIRAADPLEQELARKREARDGTEHIKAADEASANQE